MDVANNVQISAKEWMYINFRDIAFVILNTILNAKRLKLNLIQDEKLQERLFVFSNLGEMNVSQRKATYRVGIISIIAEGDSSHISHDISGSG